MYVQTPNGMVVGDTRKTSIVAAMREAVSAFVGDNASGYLRYLTTASDVRGDIVHLRHGIMPQRGINDCEGALGALR